MMHIYKISILTCIFFFKFANAMDQLFSLKINLDNLGGNISKIPMPQIAASEKLEGALKKIKSQVKYQEILKALQDPIINEAKEKSKKEINDLLAAAEDNAFKKSADSLSLELRNKTNALIDSFEKIKDGKQLKDKIEEIKSFQKRIANFPDQTTIRFSQRDLEKMMQFIKTTAIPMTIIQKNELENKAKDISNVLQKFFIGKTFQEKILKKYQDEMKNITQEINNEKSNLLIKSISQLLKTYALSFPYDTRTEFTNYENLMQFINSSALLSNISVIEKVKDDFIKTGLIDYIKNIRDQEIKKLDQLFEYHKENIKIFKKNVANNDLENNLEQAQREMSQIKAVVEQKLAKLPEIQTIDNDIKEIKNNILNPYSNVTTVASVKDEVLNQIGQEKEQAKDILNFLILYSLTPEGGKSSLIRDNMTATSAKELFSKELRVFKQGRDTNDPLVQKYIAWQSKIKELNSPFPGGDEPNYQDYLDNLFDEGSSKKNIRNINDIIISNYDLANKTLSKTVKTILNPKVETILSQNISPYNDIYREWQKKYG